MSRINLTLDEIRVMEKLFVTMGDAFCEEHLAMILDLTDRAVACGLYRPNDPPVSMYAVSPEASAQDQLAYIFVDHVRRLAFSHPRFVELVQRAKRECGVQLSQDEVKKAVNSLFASIKNEL